MFFPILFPKERLPPHTYAYPSMLFIFDTVPRTKLSFAFVDDGGSSGVSSTGIGPPRM